MQIFGIILNYVNITHIWLTKPLSEGVDHIDYYPLLLLNSAFIVKSAKILLIKRRFFIYEQDRISYKNTGKC